MPRRSLRNLLNPFRHASIDTSGKGANVSDDIQLTYEMGKLDPYLQGYFGTGVNITPAAGNFPCVELSVLNPDGILLQALIQDIKETNIGSQPQQAFVATRATPITMADGANLPIHLQTNCSPLCTARFGSVEVGELAVGQMRQMARGPNVLRGLFIPFGMFLISIRNAAAQPSGISMFWIELNRDFKPNLTPPTP